MPNLFLPKCHCMTEFYILIIVKSQFPFLLGWSLVRFDISFYHFKWIPKFFLNSSGILLVIVFLLLLLHTFIHICAWYVPMYSLMFVLSHIFVWVFLSMQSGFMISFNSFFFPHHHHYYLSGKTRTYIWYRDNSGLFQVWFWLDELIYSNLFCWLCSLRVLLKQQRLPKPHFKLIVQIQEHCCSLRKKSSLCSFRLNYIHSGTSICRIVGELSVCFPLFI